MRWVESADGNRDDRVLQGWLFSRNITGVIQRDEVEMQVPALLQVVMSFFQGILFDLVGPISLGAIRRSGACMMT
jgi:hypothetical protein